MSRPLSQKADFAAALRRRPVMAAFTATATARVQEDIAAQLDLQRPVRVVTGFDRPNLFFDVQRPKEKTAALLSLIAQRPGKSGIVYCATRNSVERVWTALNERGVSATRYHAGLSDEERRANQDDFQFDRRTVMVATNAFGMGIDKSNVSFVIHYNMPKNLESYYQEAGRAGRDGEPADCILLYSPGDVTTARCLIDHSADGAELDGAARDALRRMGLDRLPTCGLMKDTSQEQLRACLDCLNAKGYVFTDPEHATLRLGPGAGAVLFRGEQVTMTAKVRPAEIKLSKKVPMPAPAVPEDDGLLAALKAERSRLARRDEVPAYIVFSNATLADMAAKAPRDMAGLLQVSGVGEVKAARYGEEFLAVLASYRQ